MLVLLIHTDIILWTLFSIIFIHTVNELNTLKWNGTTIRVSDFCQEHTRNYYSDNVQYMKLYTCYFINFVLLIMLWC